MSKRCLREGLDFKDNQRDLQSPTHGESITSAVLKLLIEGSLEVKLPTIWRDEKQSRAEAERRGRLEERRSEEKE